MKKHNTVGDYISANKQWSDALKKLRKIILRTELNETVKWGVLVYTIEEKNIVGTAAFKSYVG